MRELTKGNKSVNLYILKVNKSIPLLLKHFAILKKKTNILSYHIIYLIRHLSK